MNRKEVLDKAAECVLQDRSKRWGEPEDTFSVVAAFWSIYLDTAIEPHQVAVMLALMKMARIKFNASHHSDSWVDLAGYAACGAELAELLDVGNV